jgi:hypothetical protein
MDIPLPPQFANRLNMLDVALIDYQSAHQSDKKEEARARMFVLSCEILSSVDIEDLQNKLGEISFQAGYAEVQKWHEAYFDEFIDLENSIFEKIGVDAGARSRMAEYTATARGNMSVSVPMPLDIGAIGSGIRGLQSEVCRLARITLAKIHVADEESSMRRANTTWRQKVVNIGISVF